MRLLFLLLGLASTLLAGVVQADEIRPGYLELRQTAADTYDLLFKIPALGDEARLALYVNLPDGVQDVAAPRALFSAGAYVERRTIRRDGGLTGRSIAIEGLSATFIDVWYASRVSPARRKPSGSLRPGHRSSSTPRRAWWMSQRLTYGSASSTFCVASITSSSCWVFCCW
jgi:hypothetical protein